MGSDGNESKIKAVKKPKVAIKTARQADQISVPRTLRPSRRAAIPGANIAPKVT